MKIHWNSIAKKFHSNEILKIDDSAELFVFCNKDENLWESKEARSVFPTENTNEKDGLSKDSGGSFCSPFFCRKIFNAQTWGGSSGHNVPPSRWNERWGRNFIFYFKKLYFTKVPFLFPFFLPFLPRLIISEGIK